MTIDNVTKPLTTEVVNIALEEMQLAQNEIPLVKRHLMQSFFAYLNSEQADYQDERKAVSNSFQSVFSLLDILEA